MEHDERPNAVLDTLRLWLRNLHRLPGSSEISDVDFDEPVSDLNEAAENTARRIVFALADLLARTEDVRSQQEMVDVLSESADDLRDYAGRIEEDIHRALGQAFEECPDCKQDVPKRDA